MSLNFLFVWENLDIEIHSLPEECGSPNIVLFGDIFYGFNLGGSEFDINTGFLAYGFLFSSLIVNVDIVDRVLREKRLLFVHIFPLTYPCVRLIKTGETAFSPQERGIVPPALLGALAPFDLRR